MDLEELFRDWEYSNAKKYSGDVRGKEFSSVDVAQAAHRAKDVLEIEAPGKDGEYVIPLFAVDEPHPTNRYVYFRPETEQIGWYDSGFPGGGVERYADCEKLETKVIGHRLRFWLPEDHPDLHLDVDEEKLPEDQDRPADRLSDAEQDAFFSELKDFVKSEREAERETNRENYREIGLREAINRNRVSGPFVRVSKTTGNDGRPAFRYQMAQDEDDDEDINLRRDEGLFEGNQCILDVENAGEHFPIEVELLSVGDTMLEFQPRWDTVDERKPVETRLNQETDVWLHELLNPVPFQRRLGAIKQVRADEKKRELLTGRRPVRFSVNKYAMPDGDIELNDYQRMALIWADGASDIVCIHGPPGTGKTRTLTAYVLEAVSQGQSVLVTAHSNQAVDNLLAGDSSIDDAEEDTLHAIAQDPEEDLSIARVGSNSRNRVIQANYMDASVSRADVVAATTSGAAQFDKDQFDVAVVDEATQASRPATAIALNCARKLVLAGDHKQLPPYCADESMQEEDMHISLFEYLLNRYGEDISVLLQRQYRMNEEIAEFPNEAFYDGNLETDSRNRDWQVADLKPLMGIDVDGSERQQTHGNSYFNRKEAEAVAKQVELLVRNDLDAEDIGVITAYSGQIGKIGHRINQLDIENPRGVTVDTVDSFQGGEREAIIVSFVRSNPDGYSGFLEFPEEGPRRLNVALTRARKRLVLVGNWETLGKRAPHRSAEESSASLYAELAEHIRSKDRMLESSVQ